MRNTKKEKCAFVGGLFIDGTGKDPVADALVLVEDGHIVYAGANTISFDGYETIDISGKTIMPGIVDTHLHFSGNLTDCDTDWVLEDDVQKAVVAVQQARECLEAGLTTVGEISKYGVAIRDMIELGVMDGPRVVATGRGFCATASHGDSHKVSSEMNLQSHPWAECVDGPWDLRKAVRRRLRENVDAIKIWSTGGGIWRWDNAMAQHYSFEEIKAVADECKLRQIPLWAHCIGSAYDSVRAGADFIIHGMQLDDETLDLMAEQGTALCPTIYFMPDWFSAYPPKQRPEHDQYPGETTVEKEMNRVYHNLRKANEKGILLTIGSDSFCSSLTPYGTTALGELIAFVDYAGISPMETIVAATGNGAKVLGVDEITGTLESGKSADLLVINGNPLEDIHVMSVENMEMIMKEGVFYKRL